MARQIFDNHVFIPSFSLYPVFRTTLFLVGLDLETSFRDTSAQLQFHQLRDEFMVRERQFHRDMSAYAVICSSAVELVSAVSILVLAIRLSLFMLSIDASDWPSLGEQIGVPILVGLFTTFALVVGVITYVSCHDLLTPQIMDQFTSEVVFRSTCLICREEGIPTANLVNLQCSENAVEAENPHWFHQECIRTWWELQDRMQVKNTIIRRGLPTAAEQLMLLRRGAVVRPKKCPICTRNVKGYRRPYLGDPEFINIEDPADQTATPPSPLAWAVFTFFTRVSLAFGGTHAFWLSGIDGGVYRNRFRDVSRIVGRYFATPLVRGVLPLLLLIMSRLFFIWVLYLCYRFHVHIENVVASPYSRFYEADLPPWYISVGTMFFFLVCGHGTVKRVCEALCHTYPPRLDYMNSPVRGLGYEFQVWANRMYKIWFTIHSKYANFIKGKYEIVLIGLILYAFTLFFKPRFIFDASTEPGDINIYAWAFWVSSGAMTIYLRTVFLVSLTPCAFIAFVLLLLPIFAFMASLKKALVVVIPPVCRIIVVRYGLIPVYGVFLNYIEDVFAVRNLNVVSETFEWAMSVMICYQDILAILKWAWYVV